MAQIVDYDRCESRPTNFPERPPDLYPYKRGRLKKIPTIAKPTELNPTGTEAAVCRDIAERQRRGIAKYGTTVAQNPLEFREWLQHAYEEALDLAVYLKRAIEEIDKE